MDYNPNGQFDNSQNGGNGSQNPYSNGFNGNPQNNIPLQKYSVPPYYPVMPQYVINPAVEQKRKDKRILKTFGFAFGLAIILYFVLSYLFAAILYKLAEFFPSVEFLLKNTTGQYILQGFLSVFCIGGSFLIAFAILKSKSI